MSGDALSGGECVAATSDRSVDPEAVPVRTGLANPWGVFFMVVLAVVLLLPALFWSLNTGFALVDDVSDWQVVSLWGRHAGRFAEWCRTTFLQWGPGRYRPCFELGKWVEWTVWGAHPAWHHAGRWMVKLLAWAGFAVAFRWMVGRKLFRPWPLLLLTYLFLFMPNQPDARLAPQELGTVFFLALLIVAVVRLQMKNAANLVAAPGIWLALLYAASLGVSWTKETNVAVLAWVGLWFTGWSLRYRSWRALLRVVPIWLLTLYTILKVAGAARTSDYGVPSLTGGLLVSNMGWLLRDLFQFGTSWAIGLPLMLLLGVMGGAMLRRMRAPGPREWCELFVCGVFGAMLVVVATSWLQVLRYWYPLVPLLAFLVASGLDRVTRSGWGRCVRGRQALGVATLLFILYFVACNLHAYYAQYAVQEHARSIERVMKKDVERRLVAGQYLFIKVDQSDPYWEFNRSLQIYFNDYLVQHKGFAPRLAAVPPPSETEGYLLAPVPVQGNVEGVCVYERAWPSAFMAATHRVSTLAQGHHPYITIDAGASNPLSYRWYLYRVQP